MPTGYAHMATQVGNGEQCQRSASSSGTVQRSASASCGRDKDMGAQCYHDGRAWRWKIVQVGQANLGARPHC
jgi:hypothetical protein